MLEKVLVGECGKVRVVGAGIVCGSIWHNNKNNKGYSSQLNSRN